MQLKDTTKEELDLLREHVQKEKNRYSHFKIDIGAGDPSPQDNQQYIDYLAKISFFWTEIFEKKMQQLILNAYGSMIYAQKDELDILVGRCRAYDEMYTWFEDMKNLHAGNLTEIAMQEKNLEDNY